MMTRPRTAVASVDFRTGVASPWLFVLPRSGGGAPAVAPTGGAPGLGAVGPGGMGGAPGGMGGGPGGVGGEPGGNGGRGGGSPAGSPGGPGTVGSILSLLGTPT
jgi:hypothetical protein